ncbi:MAG: hypothetical protein Q9171_005988 [Xanthocarpia ochracea]
MARGVKKQRGDGTRSNGRSHRAHAGISATYQDMLDEVNSSPTQTSDEGRAIKKRRIRGRIIAQDDCAFASSNPLASSTKTHVEGNNKSLLDESLNAETPDFIHPLQLEQTAYKDGSSEESDFAWEEVGLPSEDGHFLSGQPEQEDEEEEEEDLSLVLDGHGDGEREPISAAAARRKPLTAIERRHRLEVHQLHLLCLLSHVHVRNHWCNDQQIHRAMYRRLPKQIVSLLNPDENYSRFRQDESFKKGLKQASDFFRNAFTVTARGMSRSHWAEDSENNPAQPPSDLDVLAQKSDLLECANKCEGSRDVGAQLFCALLRSAGVETRLVCSLQVLPLIATTKGTTPQKAPIRQMPVIDHNPPSSDNDSDHHIQTKQRSPPSPSKRPVGSTGGITRISNPTAPRPTSNSMPRPPPRPKPKRFRESACPTYWLEVFNPHSNKYASLDPLVTHTIGKPSALTPSLSDPLNNLVYAIAFNDDLTAKDVTRRYTRSYNAKILKQRIDLTPQGKTWLSSVLALFTDRGRRPNAKEDLENAELAKKEASEPMPRNIQDFKNHPIYALERHLHRNEIILPKHEIGRVSTGTGSKNEGKSEPVYRRKDVLTCRTADQWFRLGQEIKEGEQPLKRLLPTASSIKRARRSPTPNEGADDGESDVKSLYALHQTKLYVSPPIPPSGAPIPRNAFRNLDVYVPSMVPAGGWHSLHPLSLVAATILGIDHVPAVTGFSFSGGGKGRSKGSATVTGAVIWEGHRDAVEAVLEGLEDLAAEEEEERWRAVLWGVWRKMIRGLRVRNRVRGYQIEGEDAEGAEERSEEDEDEDMNGEDEGGGFLQEKGGEEAAPISSFGRLGGRKMLLDSESEDGDLYVPSEEKQSAKKGKGSVMRASKSLRTQQPRMNQPTRTSHEQLNVVEPEAESFNPDDSDDFGGGFIPDDNPGDGGGVVPENLSQSDEGFLIEPQATEHQTKVDEKGKRHAKPLLPAPSPEPQVQASITIPPTTNRGNPTHSKSIGPTIEPTFGNLTEEELTEARLLEEFYADQKSSKVEDEASEQDNLAQGDGEVKRIGAEEGEEEEEEMNEDEEEEDKGSLISEDPSDAEAEPEWLP